ncbi:MULTISPECIES: deoxyribose-phosphate aldolase [Nosocomiicoccus]|uniref:deoxyribose-phosphate aldolase n=1 Tax=Nosocomiicoccus TaxID=489909 RepID=UPI0008A13BA3|nr:MULTISPECIES: deoxyribose-phosphate aldolase [Nosocomiicoccus]MDK6862588.1 deoxyribose-phosphate aldolase [Nosocomiicoccus ampullae]OFO51407.1 2-deoxyribose-5-phosphate aldolase [Nosocomiicoccus sp. HMSC059G07]OFS64146.1 2-deoxyribose-5-phosphate aldolase [Nosocomiicoccus sp. HMSC09A07]
MKIERYIDHTLLKPDTTTDDIKKLCEEAKQYNFFSVCVNPSHVELCKSLLEGSDTKVCTVIGFPLGATTSEVKQFETVQAIRNGADEIDMVINIGALKTGDLETVQKDIEAVVNVKGEALVKVIIETALLTPDEIVTASELSKKAGADFVKTSTGFNGRGASVEDVTLMKSTVGDALGVKASGGIRSKEDALQMIEKGATRLGASSGVKIVLGEKSNSEY